MGGRRTVGQLARLASLRSGPLLRLLRLGDLVLHAVVPASPRRAAWMSDPDLVGNALHLFRHAVTTRPHRRHLWLLADPAGRARLDALLARLGPDLAEGVDVRALDRRSLRGYWAQLRCRTVFHTHGTYPMTRRTFRRQVVSLWHGMPIKCIGALNHRSPNPNPTFGTMHLATSQYFREVIAEAFESSPAAVLVSGLPRCDVLVRPAPGAPSRAEVCEALGLPVGAPIVVWLPTYRANRPLAGGRTLGPARSFLDDVAPERCEQLAGGALATGCSLLVKLHPHDVLNDDDERRRAAPFEVLTSDRWLATGIELYDLLAVADGLVSDVSSVVIDFLLTGRPIGVVGFDASTYARDVVFPPSELLASPYVHQLDDAPSITRFFERVGAAGTASDGPDPVLRWAHDAPAGRACETVLSAAGL